jgi:hypothetical protein
MKFLIKFNAVAPIAAQKNEIINLDNEDDLISTALGLVRNGNVYTITIWSYDRKKNLDISLNGNILQNWS